MCGITGIFDFRQPVSAAQLDRFTDALAHRGPDGRGTFLDGNVGIGHRRLAILDRSDAGACPMALRGLRGERLWITFNGEVYNFIELKSELLRLGYVFRSETDTEVVLAAFDAWGPQCLERFNGMFAFAIWNETNKTLFLARDRFGVKPLYFAVQKARFAFASELKAFVDLEGFDRACDEDVAAAALVHGQALEGASDRTLLRDVQRLMPGHWLKLDAEGNVTLRKWWDTRENLVEVPGDRAARIDAFRELFFDAIRLRMRSDVPVATSLSGGMDSSAVVSALSCLQSRGAVGSARVAPDWRQAFIASFPGTSIDELDHAMEVVRHTGVKETIWAFDPTAALLALEDCVWSMEDVYPGIALPPWCLYRKMRQAGVLVSLDGHGGDELLAGYPWYLDAPLGQLNESLERDFHRTLLPSILKNFDRCSMAHGIEVRLPFMDFRLVSFVFSLPPEDKLGGGFTKRILREAMVGIMPESIRTRRTKIGFNAPMIEWFNGELGALARRCVEHPYWNDNPWWDGKTTGRALLAICDSQGWTPSDWDRSLQEWSRMNLVLWLRMFVDGERPGGAAA